MMQEGSILLAGATDKSIALMQSLLEQGSYSTLKVCRSAGEVRSAMAEGEYALVIINAPLTDENGIDLTVEIAQTTIAGVILLVKAELAGVVASRVEPSGVLVLPKPVIRQLFEQAMSFCFAARSRMLALRNETQRLQKKLEEQRMIGRAKCLLIERLRISEDQAHRLIEKEAMDSRQTRIAIARGIIDSYSD